MNTYTNLSAANAADDDFFLESVDMADGEYTLDNNTPSTPGGRKVTVTVTAAEDPDTMGTVTIVGTDLAGQTVTEVITPEAGSTISSSRIFTSVASATQAGWVINEGTPDADAIKIGYAETIYLVEGSGYLEALVINTTAAATIVLSDARGTIATLPSNAVVGTYTYRLGFVGFLAIDLNGASNVTAIHSPTLPTGY